MGSGRHDQPLVALLSAVAEAERDRTRERIAEVKRDQRTRNRYLGGIPFFGWKVGDDGQLVPVPVQQDALTTMRALRAEGLSSTLAIFGLLPALDRL